MTGTHTDTQIFSEARRGPCRAPRTDKQKLKDLLTVWKIVSKETFDVHHLLRVLDKQVHYSPRVLVQVHTIKILVQVNILRVLVRVHLLKFLVKVNHLIRVLVKVHFPRVLVQVHLLKFLV